MAKILRYAALLALLVFAGCADDDKKNAPEPIEPIDGDLLNFLGNAAGKDAGFNITCTCDLAVELDGYEDFGDHLEYTGTMGGLYQRTALDDDGAGISLWPDMHGEVIITVMANDSIYISSPANAGTGTRFYDEIALFKGVRDDDDTFSGKWRCAPFDIDEGGWTDLEGTVEGTWVLEKVE